MTSNAGSPATAGGTSTKSAEQASTTTTTSRSHAGSVDFWGRGPEDTVRQTGRRWRGGLLTLVAIVGLAYVATGNDKGLAFVAVAVTIRSVLGYLPVCGLRAWLSIMTAAAFLGYALARALINNVQLDTLGFWWPLCLAAAGLVATGIGDFMELKAKKEA